MTPPSRLGASPGAVWRSPWSFRTSSALVTTKSRWPAQGSDPHGGGGITAWRDRPRRPETTDERGGRRQGVTKLVDDPGAQVRITDAVQRAHVAFVRPRVTSTITSHLDRRCRARRHRPLSRCYQPAPARRPLRSPSTYALARTRDRRRLVTGHPPRLCPGRVPILGGGVRVAGHPGQAERSPAVPDRARRARVPLSARPV